MTLWEFNACVEGYVKANSSEEQKPDTPTIEEHRELVEKFKHV